MHCTDDWQAFASYYFPDPAVCPGLGPIDWERTKTDIAAVKARCELIFGGLLHGHTFLQLCDLRGYQHLLYDMADEALLLDALTERLEAFNAYQVDRYVEADVDIMGYTEDLGMQKGPMLPPEQFRRYVKPSCQRLKKPAREKTSSSTCFRTVICTIWSTNWSTRR